MVAGHAPVINSFGTHLVGPVFIGFGSDEQ